uniref:uncharacterized protein LOC101315240 isoform X3 n=1 Tax=Fragaria vesca subsp. vesca TaxID=101020 RepID=UPI0005C8C6A2|nr:PREDICTED: uncharacterized protein LOC101315240 isoform X3 [Fragaria vesca subsp. vesca]
MEVEVADSIPSVAAAKLRRGDSDKDRLRVKKKTLQAVLDQCQRALESLGTTADGADDDGDDEEEDRDGGGDAVGEGSGSTTTTTSPRADCEADELCNLLKSRVECPDFLEKLESAQASVPQNIAEEGNSWDLVSEKDLWEYEDDNLGEDEYVLVKQEDIVEGIACFMAAYLLSLKETKELTPTQLQEGELSPQQDILSEKEERKTSKGMGWKQSHL